MSNQSLPPREAHRPYAWVPHTVVLVPEYDVLDGAGHAIPGRGGGPVGVCRGKGTQRCLHREGMGQGYNQDGGETGKWCAQGDR